MTDDKTTATKIDSSGWASNSLMIAVTATFLARRAWPRAYGTPAGRTARFRNRCSVAAPAVRAAGMSGAAAGRGAGAQAYLRSSSAGRSSMPCAMPRLTALTTARSVAVTMFGSRPTP